MAIVDFPRAVPSRGGPPLEGAATEVWLVAIGAGLAIALLAEGSMRLARSPSAD
jgi:hypothetical protein